MSGARIEETPLRTRIALSLGALLLAGGAAFATTSLASADQSAPSPTVTQAPTEAPAPAPTTTKPGEPPRVTTAPRPAQKTPSVAAPGEHRVPKAVPAGPTGDLNLPAVVEGAGN
ncbi:hypothetical protein [Amycolatopsis sp. BJA-103]|uniref:hypothetical protein n=1 Tax=unclassified Amycolatopsis TaxID=2618356 RepID=UPI000C763AC5|nr:hypothetical protein [Amycolatopsis sp. BJA-103]AUI63044.1 hypothetical protein BKN51_36125 [Amycolatopsis sp. BJA-103]PNE18888.1 hypothetical protein B1H26_13825 [Amycolatopsis sp. BJA-103]